MRGSAAFRAAIAPGGVLAGPWVKNELWRRAKAVPSLDLRFADNKSLTDAVTGQSLVTFTRASSGTYVGSDGLIKTATTNLLLRSEEFDNASWGKTSTTVTANTTAAPNGTITADTLTWGALSTAEIYQFATLSAATHTFSIWARSASGTKKFRLKYYNGTLDLFSTEFTATTAWQQFSYSFAGVAASGNVSIRNSSPAEAGDLIVWGAQLEQSSTVGEYIPTTSTINSAPRFDHNPTTGESLGLLVEEQRTNLLLRSEEFDSASWVKVAATVTANQGVAPDGQSTADKLIENTSNVYHQLYQSFTSAVSTAYTFTVYAKAAGRNLLILAFNGTAITSGQVYCYFNLGNGTVGTNAGATSPSITAVGNGWYRCSVSTTTLSSAGTANAYLTASQDNGNTLYAGDGTSGYLIWGSVVEAGSFPTSYIPTTTAAATRSADVASITGTAFSSWYRQDEGTVFVETQFPAGTAVNSSSRSVFDATDGSTNNRVNVRPIGAGVTTDQLTIRSNGSTTAQFSSDGTAVSTSSRRLAAVYKVDDFASWATGATSAATDTSGTLPVGVNQLIIGSTVGATEYLSGTIRRLVFFPQRLANSTLQAITR